MGYYVCLTSGNLRFEGCGERRFGSVILKEAELYVSVYLKGRLRLVSLLERKIGGNICCLTVTPEIIKQYMITLLNISACQCILHTCTLTF